MPSATLSAIRVGEEIGAEKFRLLVENATDYAIFMLDVDGYVTTWNVGAERIKGYAAHEIIGRHFSTFYTPEAITDRWPAQELELAAAQGRFEDEGWRLRKDGSKFWANVVITALRDRSGTLLGYAKITRDLTVKRNVQRLEEEGRHIYRFLAMLAHELRGPLAPIANAVAIMRADAAQETTDWAREVIGRQVSQLTRLVDDLLDVQRIVTGKIKVRKDLINLCDAVTAAVEETRSMFEQRRHALVLDIPGKPVFMDGDTVRLVQVVVNLLTNAAKYTPDGGKISLSLIARADHADIIVRDNGIGIAEHMLQRIFDAFVQADSRLERVEGGLGIGLSLVRELVVQHGGSSTASSAGPGRGSEFKVTLPVRTRPVAPQPVAGSKPENAAGKALRILIIDDSQDAGDSLAMLLRLYGHTVQTCVDPQEALRVLRSFRPSVVLLDIGMPGINGYELARSIRQIDGFQNVILIAATGYGRPEDKALARAAGFDHHLVKPVDLEHLQGLIN